MGRKCCAPGCRSNYDKDNNYVTVFKFPSDPERRDLWTKSIKRADFVPSSSAVLCINHFEERFIIREDRAKRDDGTILIVQRERPALTKDAFPTVFPNLPSYLTKKLPDERKHPDERRKVIDERCDEEFNKWCSNDIIQTFEDFTSKCQNYVSENWCKIFRSEYILFFRIEDCDIPKIIVSFKVHKDLGIEIWHENAKVDTKSFEWLFGKGSKCDRWTKFENILNLLSSYSSQNLTFDQKVSLVIQVLEECLLDDICKGDDNLSVKLKFISMQIILLQSKRLRYTSDLILWCAKLHFSYPGAYISIRDSKVLTLPHPSYLKKLSSLCIPTHSFNSHISFLKNKCDLLSEEEKVVNLLLDEIYVDPSFTYNSGHIYGMSENSNAPASTIQAFMVSSILSKNKDVVALFPVRNLTAEILLKFTKDVIKVIHDCGYTVLTLISDNNHVNRNMFISLGGEEKKGEGEKKGEKVLKSFIENPYRPGKKIFFLFDSVHLIKSVRNNWLKTKDQTFFFPSPHDDKISSASLTNIINMYEIEKANVLKLAPKLSQKALFPSKIERQNVRYALNLFHDSNISALEIYKERVGINFLDTKVFLGFFSNWWKVVNVKHPQKGVHLKDMMSYPVKSLQNENFILEKFSLWLSKWGKLKELDVEEKKKIGVPAKGGMLSNETFLALKFTTDTMLEIIKYAFESLSITYVLLGKFQTDSLEARFGQYRQMSGGNYKISCLQVLESERKLKILSLLSLYSESEGTFLLKISELQAQNDNYKAIEIPNFFYDLFNSYDDTEMSNDIMSVIIYIAGYVAYKVSNKITCSECMAMLVRDKVIELECPREFFQYLMFSDRGGLKWPQRLLINVTVIAYQIFQKLISQAYENTFVRHNEPKNLLMQLILEKIEFIEIDLDKKCNCGGHLLTLIKHCLSTLSNIFLNNYTKVKNDKKDSDVKGKNASTKRKLSKLNS